MALSYRTERTSRRSRGDFVHGVPLTTTKYTWSTSFLCLGRVTFHASPTFFLRGICHGTLIPKRLGEWWILEVGSSNFVGWIFPRLSLTRQGFKNFQQQYFKAEDVALIDFILEPRKTSDARYVYQWCLPYWYGMQIFFVSILNPGLPKGNSEGPVHGCRKSVNGVQQCILFSDKSIACFISGSLIDLDLGMILGILGAWRPSYRISCSELGFLLARRTAPFLCLGQPIPLTAPE